MFNVVSVAGLRLWVYKYVCSRYSIVKKLSNQTTAILILIESKSGSKSGKSDSTSIPIVKQFATKQAPFTHTGFKFGRKPNMLIDPEPDLRAKIRIADQTRPGRQQFCQAAKKMASLFMKGPKR